MKKINCLIASLIFVVLFGCGNREGPTNSELEKIIGQSVVAIGMASSMEIKIKKFDVDKRYKS